MIEGVKYPEWATFVGAMIILLSVVMIPMVIIVRLIAYQAARDEAMEFVMRVYQSGKDVVDLIKRYIATWFELTYMLGDVMCAFLIVAVFSFPPLLLKDLSVYS